MATEEGDSKFVSCLDEKSKEKARNELHELNDKDRELAVQTFRKWVCDQDWMRTPTDFEFLLRFLRTRKFSQLEARKTLENYWKSKENLPAVYRDMDPADPDIQAIIRCGGVFGTKKMDTEGRRLMIVRPGCISVENLKEMGVLNWCRVFALVLEWMMFDENSQVNGARHLIDFTNMDFQHHLIFACAEMKSVMTFMQKSLPFRLKAVYYYNEPLFLDVLMAFFRPFMTQKLQDRINVVGNNLAALYEHVDKSLLPTEYLPDDHKGATVGSVDEVLDEMIADMNTPKFREYIRAVSSNKYGMDIKKRADMEQEPAASFRKLNVD